MIADKIPDRPKWRDLKIGDILTLEYGKALQNYRDSSGKYDVFGTNGKIGVTDSFLCDEPSLVIGRKGAYRGVHLAKSPFFVIDTAFYTTRKIEDLSIEFIYNWFKCVDINSMDSGSAIPSTSRDEVYDLDISLPCIEEQKAIAAVLSSLDDKIDLLHRQNQTLEALAATLFRQWFVEQAQEDWGNIRYLILPSTLKVMSFLLTKKMCCFITTVCQRLMMVKGRLLNWAVKYSATNTKWKRIQF